MKKLSLLLITLIIGAAIWFFNSKSNSPESSPSASTEETSENTNVVSGSTGSSDSPATNLTPTGSDDLSSNFMTEYGKESITPQRDVQQVAEMLQSYFLLVKAKNLSSLGENKDVVAALSGANPYRTRLLSPESPWLNEAGEIIDRWNTPLYFHPIDERRIGIRSAGPDKQMWTPDDLIDGPDAKALE